MKWPTPRSSIGMTFTMEAVMNRIQRVYHGNLEEVVAMRQLPTPTARDWKSPGAEEKRGGVNEERSQPLTEIVGGQLNPDWVEWLMGWPIGWTSLEPMPIEHFQEWLANARISLSNEPEGLPRITKGAPKRCDRLKAIGNGQVPQCVELAWNTLMAFTGGLKIRTAER